jgi:hypothetical protein
MVVVGSSEALVSTQKIFFPLASPVLIGPWPSLMDFSIHRHLLGLLGWGISPTQTLNITRRKNPEDQHFHTLTPLVYLSFRLSESAFEPVCIKNRQ